MARLAKSLRSAGDHYDVVIVGSGYGGGVSASRLARAGQRVCVLERGREFLTGEFPARFPDLRQEFQVTGARVKTGNDSALYDIRLGEDMHVLLGCGLGGGSLINAGVALQPDARVFADDAWPRELSDDGLINEGYARARRWLRPARDGAARDLIKVKALAASGEALGETPNVAEVVVSFEANVNPAGVAQPACTRCGDCCGGCNVGAKNTVALTYLPDALRHGAQLFTHAKVSHIAKGDHGGWSVFVTSLEDSKDKVGKDAGAKDRGAKDGGPQPRCITADKVILAAGTLGSTEILLRSRHHGLALSPRLGRGFSANGDIIAFGYGADVEVNAVGVGHPARVELEPVGACVSAQIEINDPDDLRNSMTIQEGVMPSALAPVLPALFIPNGRLLGALKSLIAGVYKGPFKHLQTFFAVSHDSASGKLSLQKDRLALSWPGAKDEPVYARMDEALETMVKAVGGAYVKNPLAGTVMGKQPATAHPLGGCGMGRDSSCGVVNHKAQVFDCSNVECRADDATAAGATGTATAATTASGTQAVHDGLYVIDGAIIPRSLGVNPLLTITALAERAMLLMAEDNGWQFDAAAIVTPTPATPDAPGAVASSDGATQTLT